MNNEFKKSKSNNETRYTLESMTAGATGSGSVATATGSLGKVQKRGNILAQEAGKDKVPATTPRNFVAKNAKTSGAGAHKDKKKEQKQGAEKHKKPYMESLRTKIDQLKSRLAEQGGAEGDRPGMKDGRPYSDPLRRHPGNDSYMTPEYLIQKYQDELKKIAAGPYKRPKDVAMYQARIAKLQRQQGVAEGFPKDPNAPKLVRDRKTGKQYDPNKEFEKKMTSPEVMAQMKRMAQKEGVAVAEADMNRRGFLKGLGAAALGGAGVGAAQAGIGADLAGAAAKGLGYGMTARVAGSAIHKEKNAADLAFAEKIPDAWDKTRYLKAVKYIIRSRDDSIMRYAGHSGSASRGSIIVAERNFKKLKTELSQKYNIPLDPVKEQGVAEASEDRTSYQVAKILSDRGIKYDPAQENELINAIGMVLVKELNMSPKEARNLISYDEDFVADTLGELRSMEQSVAEVDVYMESLANSLQQVLNEKAVSKKQQKFMGMVHAAQKGEKPASKEVAKVAKDMGKKDAKDFAATKHKGLPEKKPKK